MIDLASNMTELKHASRLCSSMLSRRFHQGCKLSFTMEFGKRLEEALRIAGKERKDLADALGVSAQAIGQVIKGDTKALTAENCARAARFLGVDFYWLATGDGTPIAADFARLDAYESNLVTNFRQLSPEDQRTLLISVNGRVRSAADITHSGEVGGALGAATSDRENNKRTDLDETWKDTSPQPHIKTTPTTPSTGRGLGRTIETEGQDQPPARKRGYHQ
jgi:transcriptional regulator with XRE-family HTH domain